MKNTEREKLVHDFNVVIKRGLDNQLFAAPELADTNRDEICKVAASVTCTLCSAIAELIAAGFSKTEAVAEVILQLMVPLYAMDISMQKELHLRGRADGEFGYSAALIAAMYTRFAFYHATTKDYGAASIFCLDGIEAQAEAINDERRRRVTRIARAVSASGCPTPANSELAEWIDSLYKDGY